MARHKADIEIAYRAYSEAIAKFGTVREFCTRTGLDRRCVYEWHYGSTTHSAYSLQPLALAGLDIHYVLTGFRRNQ